jgi:hypothetical protein
MVSAGRKAPLARQFAHPATCPAAARMAALRFPVGSMIAWDGDSIIPWKRALMTPRWRGARPSATRGAGQVPNPQL